MALMLRAFLETGHSRKTASGVLGISESLFSQQFSWDYADKHPSLKRISDGASHAIWRRFALLLCEELGLAVAGPDEERHALADVAEAMVRYLRIRR